MLAYLLRVVLFGLGFLIGFALPWFVYLDRVIEARFRLDMEPVPSRVYAAPLLLQTGMALPEAMLRTHLEASRYLEQEGAAQPGSYSKVAGGYTVYVRAFTFAEGHEPAQRLQLNLRGGALERIVLANGQTLPRRRLDPARIATFYGADETERLPMSLVDMPVLLVAGVQAVEDRKFAHHHGVDPIGFLRAVWTNLRAGELSQGGSTITQQLVKNTLLSRAQTIERKLKEVVLALLLERRYDKGVILEAYLNRAVLGQLGNQPIQGFPAAAEFFYGRPLDQLRPSELALLVGLLKASDRYDPRRNPERARQRRDLVLRQFHETGLINQAQYVQAQGEPLNIIPRPSAARNRHPAYLDLVSRELRSRYDPNALTSAGLSIHTLLDVHAQIRAETAIQQQLQSIDPKAQLQAAVVVTSAETGAILAAVGGRDPRAVGFNRALTARRPVGSLLKPFVFLLALSDPERYSLASMVDDSPYTARLPNGQRWSPENYDRKSRGQVALIDALAQSLNQATARLGMELGVPRLAQLLNNLGLDVPADPPPAILLGAIDLSPLDIAQAYQGLASGGRVLPLRTVTAVLDSQGKVLSRTPEPSARPVANAAVQLVNFALNATTRSGTAQSVARGGQIKIDVAGKTGTSNDSRDSWYAGFTGSHLGVVWLGRDDNQSTGLTGASGALKVWTALFAGLPSQPLHFNQTSGMSFQAFDTGQGCAQWRFLPVLPPYRTANSVSCMDALMTPE